MTEREQQILSLLRQDPLIPQQALADRLGISRPAVATHIVNLMNKGLIRGKGYILAEAPRTVVIGGANMDITGIAGAPLRQGDSNPGRVLASPGGVARNIAENLARLGLDVRLVSVVGDDLHGRSLLEATQRAGVDVQNVLVLPDAATPTYLSIQGPDGDMALAINDMDALARLTPARLVGCRELVRHAGRLIADANLSEDALAWLFAEAQAPVMVDPVSAFKAERLRPWLARISLLKPNRLEAASLSGLPLTAPHDAPRVADWFHEQGVQQVVLSLGSEGLFYSDGHSSGWAPAVLPAGGIVNTTGAGDALMAGLACGLQDGLPLEESARMAQACAALTLATPMTNSPILSRAAVEACLAQEPARSFN